MDKKVLTKGEHNSDKIIWLGGWLLINLLQLNELQVTQKYANGPAWIKGASYILKRTVLAGILVEYWKIQKRNLIFTEPFTSIFYRSLKYKYMLGMNT